MAQDVAAVNGDVPVEMAVELSVFFQNAALQGKPLRDVERGAFDRLLQIGHAATEQFLTLQGNGDLGETTTDDEGRTLHRSPEPVDRPLRTIFGEHRFQVYVDRQRRRLHTPISLRQVDARLGIDADRWSPLVKEFTLLFGVEQAFDQAATFKTTFRQRLSVDTLEQVSRKQGAAAREFLDPLHIPPADEEGELLVLTAHGKGVPLVQVDAVRVSAFEDRPLRPGNRRMATLAAGSSGSIKSTWASVKSAL